MTSATRGAPSASRAVGLDGFSYAVDASVSVQDGAAARIAAPRRGLAALDTSQRVRTALQRLRDQEGDRLHDLLGLRYARMAESPWAYLRGAAAVMAADLGAAPHSGLRAQICGDAHILNFGLWASPERELLFDPRDFDETCTGPFEWDLKRLATSIHVLARANGIAAEVADQAVATMLRVYRDAMRTYARAGELAVWYDRIPADLPMTNLSEDDRVATTRGIRSAAKKRSGETAVRKYTETVDGQRRITIEPPKRERIKGSGEDLTPELVAEIIGTYADSLPWFQRRLLARFQRVDAVRQVVGVGSVGMRIALVLLVSRSGRQPLMLQIKQAAASVYEPFLGPSSAPFANHGQRVAVGQRLMQSASDIFLGWTSVGGRDFYVRQFRDMKIIPDGPTIGPILPQFAGVCGRALAKSHARSGDPDAINAYIGKGRAFDAGIAGFALAYADQTERDHADLVAAIQAGAVPTVPATS